MPKLKTVLPNLDDLDESMHEFYVEKDGKFVLDLEGVDVHPDVVALKNALDRQKSDRRTMATDLAALKEKIAKVPEDFDADAYQTAMHELEELRNNKNTKTDDKERADLVAARKTLEQKISGLEKSHAEAIKKKDENIKKRDGKIHQLLIDEGLTKALIESGVGSQYLKAAKALLKNDCTVIEEDGDYRAIVESDMGQLDISKYVSDWVASDDGKPFVPPAKGGDADNKGKPTNRKIGEKNPWTKEHYNLTEQGRVMREDRSKAEKFAKEAGATLPPPAAA